jgi:DNA processing protein
MKKDLKYLNAFNQSDFLGAQSFKKIKKYFKSYEKAWFANLNEFKKINFSENIISEIKKIRLKVNPDKEIQKIIKYHIQILTPQDKLYPPLLKNIAVPPQILYTLGNQSILSQPCLAVVGSRHHSIYGKKVVEKIIPALVEKRIAIVAGLALGIDSLGHQATLRKNGKTIAVLGSGLARIYPTSNRFLAKQILEKDGLLISEFPLTSSPLKKHFPMRNRIISGLSLGTVVIEAAERSGSLITANFALEQGRDVFAVPGNIFSQYSQGANMLIQQGAKLVSQPKDILEELDI